MMEEEEKYAQVHLPKILILSSGKDDILVPLTSQPQSTYATFSNTETENGEKFLPVADDFPPESLSSVWLFTSCICFWPVGYFAVLHAIDSKHSINRGLKAPAWHHRKRAEFLAKRAIVIGVFLAACSIGVIISVLYKDFLYIRSFKWYWEMQELL